MAVRRDLVFVEFAGWHQLVMPLLDDADFALQKFNAKLHADERADLSLLPIGDGLTLARKR